LISVNDVDNYKSNEILILTTGTQGEELAALNKMATNTHQKIKLNEDDYVIFSSNPIPGNFESVELLINNLAKTGAHVFISNKESKIHSSGHATQTELELMIKLVNPLYLMPIHGEFKMLTSLCREGNNLNIPPERLILTKNGRIVELNNHRLSITDELVPTNDVFIEGKNIVSDRGSNVISTRQILGQEGIISITVLVDQTKKTVINSPIIIVRGTFRSIDSKELIDALSNSVKNNVNSFLAQTNEFALDKIKNIINKTILLLVEKYKYKKPYITSTVFLTN
jgi:ribonuclease J